MFLPIVLKKQGLWKEAVSFIRPTDTVGKAGKLLAAHFYL